MLLVSVKANSAYAARALAGIMMDNVLIPLERAFKKPIVCYIFWHDDLTLKLVLLTFFCYNAD
jgi:hypothetical protein